MMISFDPDPGDESPQVVRMIVEIPQDSTNKYEYDGSLGLFRLSRALYSPIHYPGDYGFIPGTLAEDGEALDVLCSVTAPSFTGCLSYVRPIGVLDMLDGKEVDHKILAVPGRDPRYDDVNDLAGVGVHTQREIEHFFRIYKELEGRRMQMRGWGQVGQAHEIIQQSRSRFLAAEERNAMAGTA
jgi:inorganic pyrophosphatase